MTGIDAIPALGAHATAPIERSGGSSVGPQAPSGPSFANMIAEAVQNAETRIDRANELVAAFALDDTIPIHQVTIALEEARLAVELALQVRNRLTDGYREIMNMQL